MDAVTAKKKTQLVRKHKIGLFLQNELSEFIRMKKSTSLTLSMNPVEEETDYIADESPSTELTDYKPSIDQDLVMYAGEEDYEMMWKYMYELRTGSDAHTDCMIVFMHRPVDAQGNDIPVGDESAEVVGYRAWLTNSIISVQDMNATEKKLNFKVLFGGGITKGIATVDEEGSPAFTPADKWKPPGKAPEPGSGTVTPNPGEIVPPGTGDNSGTEQGGTTGTGTEGENPGTEETNTGTDETEQGLEDNQDTTPENEYQTEQEESEV